jgi:hypothetical protein
MRSQELSIARYAASLQASTSSRSSANSLVKNLMNFAFEAGADAMLEAVIKLVERLGHERVADDIKLFTMEAK